MAFIVVSTDRTTAIVPQSGDVIIVPAGRVVTSPGDGIAGFFSFDLTIRVDGTVAGEDNGVETGANANISIGEDGALLGKSCGLWLNGAGSTVSNAGTIQSLGTGISFIQAALALNNTSDSSISNTGQIIGAGIGVDFRASTGLRLHNSGEILAQDAAITGLQGAYIDNSGLIDSATGVAIDLGTAVQTGLRLVNSGTISAPSLAILGTAQTDRILSSGRIEGDVQLGGGDDVLRNRGEIVGNVDVGDGQDQYRSSGWLGTDGTVSGGAGNDLMIGGEADEIFAGGTGNDILRGGAGDDDLRGNTGNDIIDGGAGNDELYGGVGTDVFVFQNGSGQDRIRDFNLAADERIDLSGNSRIVSFTDLANNHLSLYGASALIDDGAGARILIAGIQAAALQPDDFIF